MKKVAIITFNRALSHGAVLQTYALQEYVDGLGCESDIIDYIPPRFRFKNALFVQKKKCSKIKKIIRAVPYAISKKNSWDVMNEFNKKYINNTKKKYYSTQVLQELNGKYDVYMTGSDQVWNYKLDEFKYIEPYLLSFCNDNSLKVSYAASIGADNLEQLYDEKNRYVELLKRYNYISVREESAKEILADYNIDSEVVLDPTLLITADEWKKIAIRKKHKKEYVLIYGLYRNKKLYEAAYELKRKFDLNIINVSDNFEIIKGATNITKISADKLIGLIMDAKFVVTDSFHGMAFSLNFNVPFFAFPASRGNTRVKGFVKKFQIEDRYIEEWKDYKDYNMNFTDVNSILKIERKKSGDILKKMIFTDGSKIHMERY